MYVTLDREQNPGYTTIMKKIETIYIGGPYQDNPKELDRAIASNWEWVLPEGKYVVEEIEVTQKVKWVPN